MPSNTQKCTCVPPARPPAQKAACTARLPADQPVPPGRRPAVHLDAGRGGPGIHRELQVAQLKAQALARGLDVGLAGRGQPRQPPSAAPERAAGAPLLCLLLLLLLRC